MGPMNVDIPLGHTSKVAGYPPINDYTFIGDCRSAELISRDGSPDFAPQGVTPLPLEHRAG